MSTTDEVVICSHNLFYNFRKELAILNYTKYNILGSKGLPAFIAFYYMLNHV